VQTKKLKAVKYYNNKSSCVNIPSTPDQHHWSDEATEVERAKTVTDSDSSEQLTMRAMENTQFVTDFVVFKADSADVVAVPCNIATNISNDNYHTMYNAVC